MTTNSKLEHNISICSGRIFDICPTFCVMTLNLEGSLQLVRLQKIFPISMKYGM